MSTEVDTDTFVKLVYFDEESASDFLDITAGGKVASSSEKIRDRTVDTHAKVESGLAAKFSWLPFIGASAEASAGVDVSRVGHSILRKTLSNTILTDYLAAFSEDPANITRLDKLALVAPKDSMAFMKMYTPYMIVLRDEDMGLNVSRLDEALEGAKGYYELLATGQGGKKTVLRFNLQAFRNNYSLSDLIRMNLIFHGVHVGSTRENELGMQAEMDKVTGQQQISVAEILDGGQAPNHASLDVYDIILAGVGYRG
jgi:hypothetical protein